MAAMLLVGLSAWAADSTIGNLSAITTVPDNYRMPWENNGVLDYYITFNNLTNQILGGLGTAAYKGTSFFDAAGAAAAAQAASLPLHGTADAVASISGNSVSSPQITTGLGYTPPTNTAAGIVTALGYTPLASGSNAVSATTATSLAGEGTISMTNAANQTGLTFSGGILKFWATNVVVGSFTNANGGFGVSNIVATSGAIGAVTLSGGTVVVTNNGNPFISLWDTASGHRNWRVASSVTANGDFAILYSGSAGASPGTTAMQIAGITSGSVTAGNVGIGTTSPSSKLVVIGDSNVSGTLTATNGVVLPLTATPPTIGAKGGQLFCDGTNVCIVLQNSAGTLSTNRITMSAFP